MSEGQENQINAEPTKTFFVDMLTRDIPLEQAVLDLVDNSVDGAKRIAEGQAKTFEGLKVEICLDKDKFSITDNCGGFDRATARDYAFRFGRPPGVKTTPHSIGQFGVGMKRALFKFGRHFIVRSATQADEWEVDVDVDKWEAEDGWHFPWANFNNASPISKGTPGTQIIVSKLRTEVASKFAIQNFANLIVGHIKSKHRQFISNGLAIIVNGKHIDATNLLLTMSGDIKPGRDSLELKEDGFAPVSARIIVGVGSSSPREAGWYVVCNGRVILEADRRPVTGWGLLEDNANRIVIPSFHNQFARFRGIVFFDSEDSSRVPWNTTKTDVDQDSAIWRMAFERMLEVMRPVIDFLNELDADIDEKGRDHSDLLQVVTKAPQQQVKAEEIVGRSAFTAPSRDAVVKGPRLIKIQYSRPVDDVGFLQEALGLSSAKAVGERTFDLILKRQRDE